MPDPDARLYSPEFSHVLTEELKLIRTRRSEILQELSPETLPANPPRELTDLSELDQDQRMSLARQEALSEHLTGIAFSGGGIRSGTFAVGVLQGLAMAGLLRRFDYVSTVSGGGYAGGWLAAWLKRDGSVRNVENQLASSRVRQGLAYREELKPPPSSYPPREPSVSSRVRVVDEEPEPLRHLRSYSSYMAPRLGLLTADTWTIIMIWLRNVMVNMMMFLPLTMVVVLVVRSLVNLAARLSSTQIDQNLSIRQSGLAATILGSMSLSVVFLYNGLALREFRLGKQARRWKDEGSGIYYWMIYPTVVGSILLSFGMRPVLWSFGNVLQEVLPGRGDWELLGVGNMFGHALVFGLFVMAGSLGLNLTTGTIREHRSNRFQWIYLFGAFMAGATDGVLLTLVEQGLKLLTDGNRPELAAMLGTPSILLVLAVSMIVEVAMLGRSITEAEREWWSRFGALMLISGILWIVVFATVLYVPALFLGFQLPLRLIISSGWVGTIVAGIFAGQRVRPASKGGSNVLSLIAGLAPPIFLLGMVGAVALLVSLLVNEPRLTLFPVGGPIQEVINYFNGLRGASLGSIGLWMLVFGGLSVVGLLVIDVNLFSLNAMYANRLIRCYLGASRSKRLWVDRWSGSHDRRVNTGAPTVTSETVRDENPVTGFDPTDDLDLIDFRIGRVNPDQPGDRPYRGPMLLVNATINLVGGNELAWRDRKGESFTLSPLYCGSKGTGYALVGEGSRKRLTLGRSMSISGAAVDPNMRFYQSAALTAFLTLMNARLGFWMQNPVRPDWSAQSPRFGDLLLKEFLGRTDGRGDFVHLSDGGHFENMGVYELVRRRCRYIVACDAGEDTGPSDENLAILMRLVLIDFGIRIELDTGPFRSVGDDALTRAHVIVGRVHYEDVDRGQLPGILVYVRISMTGDEPSDVQQYARSAPDFPHQSTDLKQSFSEDQFESYRSLGEHIARTVFVDAAERVGPEFWSETDPHREFVHGNRRLFSEVASRWNEAPMDQAARSIESSAAWIALRRDLREKEGLGRLVDGAFPESVSAEPQDDLIRPEMQAVGQMLQMMENAWLDLGLAGRATLPTNRGWMNSFRRWVGSESFHQYWPVFRAEISPDFARFLEKELHLTPPRRISRAMSEVHDPDLLDRSIRTLTVEFDREWPEGDSADRSLSDLIDLAGDQVWLLYLAPSGPRIGPTQDLPDQAFVVGIVLIIEDSPESWNREMVAWIRRPHRASGIGNRLIGPLIESLHRRIRDDFRTAGRLGSIRTHYPKSGREGDTDGDRDRWLNFFSMYDFQPRNPETPPARRDSEAVRRVEPLGPRPINGTASAPGDT